MIDHVKKVTGFLTAHEGQSRVNIENAIGHNMDFLSGGLWLADQFQKIVKDSQS